MEIKTIKCTRLNKAYREKMNLSSGGGHTPDLEVFVGFSDSATAKPENIMCDEYQSNTKNCGLNNKPCTYDKWK